MLKIKDDVDLKELKKFGFVDLGDEKYQYDGGDFWFDIYEADRVLETPFVPDNYLSQEYATLIFDLIQAGFVEKVGEK